MRKHRLHVAPRAPPPPAPAGAREEDYLPSQLAEAPAYAGVEGRGETLYG